MKKTKKDKDIVYVLKRCIYDNVSYNDFKYPLKKGSIVEAPDWEDMNRCGNGLHGWTEGHEEYFDSLLKGNFVILEVNKNDGYVELENKVKFRKGKIIMNTPDASKAHDFMKSKYPNMILHFNVSNQGDLCTSNQGNHSTSNQGDLCTSNQGNHSASNQGNCCTVNQWNHSTATVAGDTVIYRNNSKLGCCILFNYNKMKVIKAIPNTSIYVKNMKIINKYTSTPDNIRKLKPYEVFVFSSNLKGCHFYGSAKLAVEHFGAVNGVGEGLEGQSYAFPILDDNFEKIPLEKWDEHIDKLVKTANENTKLIFLVTRLGCCAGGFNEKDVKDVFKRRRDISANIILPKGWRRGE